MRISPIIMKKIRRKVSTTRTHKFDIIQSNKLDRKFSQAQPISLAYKHYGLIYLYENYGIGHLNRPFPKGIRRKYLVNNMVNFARKYDYKSYNYNLREEEHNIQSVDKMLDELCINFLVYRRKQYKLRHYWSQKEIKHYLSTHNCSLRGYGRIRFNHSLDNIKSLTFKQNGYRIYLINNYTLKVPYFGNVMVKQSLTYLKHKHINEVRLVKKVGHVKQLQIVTNLKYHRHIHKKQLNSIQGLDVNSKNDNFFCFSDGNVVSWNKSIKNKYNQYDNQARKLQKYLTTKNHRYDGSHKTKLIKIKLRKIKAKAKFMIDQWQIDQIHQFIKKYPVLSIEDLKAFTMRLNKRYKKKFRKNTNHKLAKIHPTRFKHLMEDIYQDNHCLLLVVNPFDTSKCCHNDGSIHNIGLKKRWYCNICHQYIDRDPNSTYNIKDWSIHPEQHALWRLHNKYPQKYRWVKLEDLVKVF